MNEWTGYGFTKVNNFRPRRRSREIDQGREFIPAIKGGRVLGTTCSKRGDRMEANTTQKGERKFWCAARTMVVMPGPEGEDSGDVGQIIQSNKDGEPETRVDLANRMLKKQGVNKTKYDERVKGVPSNGPNVYAWNEVFKFKDHKMN